MKTFKLISVLLFISFSANSYAADSCQARYDKAAELLNVMEKYNVEAKTSEDDVNEAKATVADGTFCDNLLNSYSLCTSLTVDYAYFKLNTENPADQRKLEKALKAFGELFPSQAETDGFSCDLKELDYPTLN